ncbi:STAS domain-containing protein [Solidesulfovibrio sp. C21]|uniref:STAS domain-containing protein n=1 Tax=Solidesulfovibrio sp. C21 TaxID=3398613 RepID=UPI0039FD38B7
MDLIATQHGPVTLVTGLPKTFDYTVCPDFQRCLAPHIETAPKVLVIDLSGVEFLDSSAIGSLITVRNRLLPEGGSVALCSIADGVAKVLRITDLGKVFAIFDDADAALAALTA